jgi:hypothetical protein
MSDTQIRVPFTQGLPPQTAGSMAIRSKSVFMAEILDRSHHGEWPSPPPATLHHRGLRQGTLKSLQVSIRVPLPAPLRDFP